MSEGVPIFEFDEAKSVANLEKHGIDFVQAQQLWNDPDVCGFEARSTSEIRRAMIAQLNEHFWTAFFTYRNASIRIISVRRARHEEVARYVETKHER